MDKKFNETSNYINNKKGKVIFSRKYALYLRENGCKILQTKPNMRKPEFDVWIFEDNNKLKKAMQTYMKEVHKGEKAND